MLLEPGALFDRYRIEALLGEGGMGRVYRAYDERLTRRIALKVLHAEPLSAPTDSRPRTEGGARLLREARAAAALDHPNAVAIFDVGETREAPGGAVVPFIAMELIEGRSLRAYMGVNEVPLTERVRWLIDVARALSAAHKRGLVHRDVKPENVMVRDDGVIKVLDFGIARRAVSGKVDPGGATEAVDAMGTLTGRGIVVGTPLYMAPEQMRGESLDGRADQFSWGVVAFELLTGLLPWDREGDSLKVVSQILSIEPPAIRSIRSEIPATVEAIVARALAKSPANRFGSMDEIVHALDTTGPRSTFRPQRATAVEVLGTAPTVQSTKTSLAAVGEARPVPTAPPLAKTKLQAAGAVALVTLAGVAISVGLSRRHRATDTAADAVAPRPTAVTELGEPKTSPEALVAYDEAMAAYRTGDLSAMTRTFRRAVDLDPRLAPALMRLGHGLLLTHPAEAREDFRRAVQLRETLSERDRGLLEALEPYVQREPSDIAETRARVAKLIERYPLDAELFQRIAELDAQLFDRAKAIEEDERAISLDPRFAFAMVGKADALGAQGEFEEAIAASRECEHVAPGVSNCAYVRWEIEEQEGRCEDLEGDARQMIVVRPESPNGYRLSVRALSSLGAPPNALREGIAQARARMTELQQHSLENALLEAKLEVLQGHFAEAETVARAYEALPATQQSAEANVHALGASFRAELALEEGRTSDAADIAEDFRGRSLAWTPPPARQPSAIRFDSSLALLGVLVHAGRVPSSKLAEARDAWLARGDAHVSPEAGGYLWIAAYAREASTAAEAKEALDALPRFQPLPALWESPTDFVIGRTYFLAGRTDEAVPHLRRATKICDTIDDPFGNTHANLFLGEALESQKDVPGACAAYRVVLDRWGHAKPRSVSADIARARASALGCPR